MKSDAAAEPTEKPQSRLRNPFRNEADAFRLFVFALVGIALIVAATKFGGSYIGLGVAAVVLLVAARATYRWFRLALSEREL